MKSRTAAAVLVAILTLAWTTFAKADITGNWDVVGVMKTKVAIKKFGSDTSKELTQDLFEFEPGYSFSMMDFPNGGTWEYVKKKVLVHLDEEELQEFFKDELETMLWDEAGIEAEVRDVVILKNAFTVQERKNGTIKGKLTIGLTCVIDAGGYDPLLLKMNVKYGFTGTRSFGSVTSVDPQRAASGFGGPPGALPEAFLEGILKRLSETLPLE